MARYAIEDTTLTALGDAVRAKVGETRNIFQPFDYLEFNWSVINEEDYVIANKVEGIYRMGTVPLTIHGAKGYKIVYSSSMNVSASQFRFVLKDIHGNEYPSGLNIQNGFNDGENKEHTLWGEGYYDLELKIQFFDNSYETILEREYYMYLNAKIYALDENKNIMTEVPIPVPNTMTPMGMVEQLNNITIPNMPEAAYLITKSCEYRFANNGWNWFLKEFKDKLKTDLITNCSHMFDKSTELESIPFDINTSTTSIVTTIYMFQNCENLKEVPRIPNLRVNGLNNMFDGCRMLREIPDDYAESWDWNTVDNATSAYVYSTSAIFNNCCSLRRLPSSIIKHVNPYIAYSYYTLAGMNYLYALDELQNIPVPTEATWTSNAFSNSFKYWCRMKNLTFQTNEDGTPKTAKWKSQTIDLKASNYPGYLNGTASITNYNSGITEDKRVTDAESYAALKDDPDWWTTNAYYSRYNHDSAVATINSLPDTSAYLATAGGTNTIKFGKGLGTSTDGGAVDNLTEEEIAVAAAKGWTVTFATN